MSARARTWLLVFCLIGLGASAAATYVHYHLLRDPSYTSVCDVSATVSCTQVYASRFGTIRGVPVALLGLLWFALTLLLLVAAIRGSDALREDVSSFIFGLSTIGLAVVLYLAYASFFVLKTVCVFCLITYAAVIGLFLVSGAATAIPMTTLPRRAARDLQLLRRSPLAVLIAALFLAMAGSAVAFFPREGDLAAAPEPASQDQRSDFERWFSSQPRVPIMVPSDGAKVVVVKFNDYQCPPCRQSYMNYKSVFAKYDSQKKGEVKVVYKDFPLDSECNASVANGGPHPSACEAAVAVRLSREHNREEQMTEWLFANQPSLTPALVKQAAHDVGGVNDYDARYAQTLELVKGDIALGRQLGVKSTPTFFVDGIRIEGALPPQYFDQAIQYELKRAQ